jgi:hypothetical protein
MQGGLHVPVRGILSDNGELLRASPIWIMTSGTKRLLPTTDVHRGIREVISWLADKLGQR